MNGKQGGQEGAPSVVTKAILLARQFWKFAGDPPAELPVPLKEFLVPQVEKFGETFLGPGHQIILKTPSYPKNKLLSTLRQSQTVPVISRILYYHGVNRCNTRYAIAVELGNIIAGQDESLLTVDIVNHLTNLAAGKSPQPHTSLFGERLGQALAIELLVPMAHAPAWTRFVAEGADSHTVATAFRIPQIQAEWLLYGGGWSFRAELHERANQLGS